MQKLSGKMRLIALLAAVMLALGLIPTGFAQESELPELTVSDNPLIAPLPVTTYTQTEDEFLNILLMGLDLSYAEENIITSSQKTDLMIAHADGIILAAINLTRHTISLISIPRDTLVYVPGVRGIYKANNTFNCAEDPMEGCRRTCEAVGYLLNGIRVDKFLAVDVEAMITLCDAIGGVDFDMDMSYVSGDRRYKQGFQHLDGLGIFDYVRARKNSSGGNYTDIARTRRQRKMMEAIYEKVRGDLTLINAILDEASRGDINVFSNLDINDLFYLMQVFMSLENTVTESYGLEGDIKLAFGNHGWNYCFTDQGIRREVMQNVFGLTVEDAPYTSFSYTEWLKDRGFGLARQIILAGQILEHGKQQWSSLSDTQQTTLITLAEAYNAAVPAFATETQNTKQETVIKDTNRAINQLNAAGKAAAKALGYMEDAKWVSGVYYFRDPILTDYTEIDWR